jgi:hypothetical protein
MTPEEVYRELEKDMGEVAGWWMKKRQLQVRIAKWTIKLPRTTWFEYESSRKNRYMVLSIIMGRNYNDESMTGLMALQKMDKGFAVYVSKFPWQRNACPHVFLPHVFDRYHDPERGNVKKTGIELIKHFMERNAYGEISRGDKFSGRSVRYKGRDNIAKCVTDGVLLGEITNDIFVAHTFITYEMTTGLQREEFEKNKGIILSNDELMRRYKQQNEDMKRMMIEEARETVALMVNKKFV